jgi:DNA-3-methyladenine glycosylase
MSRIDLSALRPLDREFYRRDSRTVARELLNKVLARGGRAGRIVEVEAYAGSADPASHAYRGRTRRNASMFGPPGLLYVYFIYGVHWCANVVCGEEGEAQAVLLRGLAPLSGLAEMRAARPKARRERDLCSGPARLCQALGIDGDDDGADLVAGERGFLVAADGTPPPPAPGAGPRIGISNAADRPWRFYLPGDPNLSRPG